MSEVEEDAALSRILLKQVGRATGDVLRACVEEGSAVTKVCDALVADLENMCHLVKQYGVTHVRESSTIGFQRIPITFSWRDRKDDKVFGGTYVGFGLGEHWLDLGFLAEPVVEALKKRFEDRKRHIESIEPSTYETRCGQLTYRGNLYLTDFGCFEISHTYCWVISRRVD